MKSKSNLYVLDREAKRGSLDAIFQPAISNRHTKPSLWQGFVFSIVFQLK